MKSKQTTHTVEFIGGPFDGYRHEISFEPSELAEVASLPINANVLQMLGGHKRGKRAPASSVSIYELEQNDGSWKYRHVGESSVEHFQLEGWAL